MRERARFDNRMTKTETLLGWLYVPVHILILPILLNLYLEVNPGAYSSATGNLIYYGVGVVYVLCFLLHFLRGGYDAFLDRPGHCLLSALLGLAASYALALAAATLLLLLLSDPENPNNEAVMRLAATEEGGVVRAVTLFLVPIVEETLFRGVAFGSIRTRSRVAAYVVSALLFALYHVWQYAVIQADPAQLIYGLQYLPMALALAWCYERTGSIWAPMLMHMVNNAVAFSVLGMV